MKTSSYLLLPFLPVFALMICLQNAAAVSYPNVSGDYYGHMTYQTIESVPGHSVTNTQSGVNPSLHLSQTGNVFSYTITAPGTSVSITDSGTLSGNAITGMSGPAVGLTAPAGTVVTQNAITSASGFVKTNEIDFSGKGHVSATKSGVTETVDITFSVQLLGNVTPLDIPDTIKPLIAITDPVPNQTIGNNIYTVVGTANDNSVVADVLVSTDGINWTEANSFNGFTDWWLDVGLNSGTNFIYAYSVDGSGNYSPTNKVKVVYNYVNLLVPSSFQGLTIFQSAQSGDGSVFYSSGDFVVLTANNANTYQYFDLAGGSRSGSFGYIQQPSDGILNVNDPLTGQFSADYAFTDAADGTYTYNQSSSGGNQAGTFSIFTGNAPISVAGYRFNGSVINGGGTSSGSWEATFGTSTVSGIFTNSDTTTENFSGTYSNSRINSSTIKLVSNENGGSQSFYFAFSDSQSGYYLKTAPSNSWQWGTFSMQTAPETTPPTVTITSPSGTQVVSNSVANITGTAHDNVAVADVMYSTDGVNWTDATTGNGWTNWTASLTLNPGLNTVSVQAVDTHGNYSAVKIVVLIYDTGAGLGLAPASLRGGTIFQTASSAAAPFDYPNYGLVFFADTGNSFKSGGVQDNSMANPGSGSYTYFPLNGDGFFVASNHVGIFTGDYTFSDPADGNYSIQQPSSGGFQNGSFIVYTGSAPASLSGLMFTGQETDGENEGIINFPANFWVSFAGAQYKHFDPASGNTNIGAYTYSLVNHSTGKIVFNNNPNSVAYLMFDSPTSCAFAQHDSSGGGWAVGTFNVSEIIPPTLTLTAPVAAQRWSNDMFTVRGKASDNVAVADVLVSADGVNWIEATPINNWSNWTAAVMLPAPGTNTIFAYAVDTSGNVSTTNHAALTYVSSAPLTVQTNPPGWGMIVPGYNNALLQISNNYLMTATAKPGFAFTNWTDGDGNVITNKPTLKFLMASNLIFVANFADVQKPTLSITNIPTNGKFSNEFFTVKGKAGDNVGVANLWYNVNNTGWVPADSVNNYTNWSGLVDLSPGLNVIVATAADAAGNTITVTSRVTYVLSAPLAVQTNLPGWGTISPNYNNALLQISNKYTMTAAAKPGFAFTNWTDCDGNLITNKPVMNFIMASNLCFRANFLDVQKPVLSITNIPAGGKFSNEFFTVRGKAGDNVSVASLLYNVNNTGWVPADSANNYTNWSGLADLSPGLNVIVASAVDAAGNSITVTSLVTYVLSAPLAVQTNLPGWGTITPGYNNALLQISNSYAMTAAAMPGFAFTNWTDCDGNLITNKPALNFIMASNLCFRANFFDVQKPVVTIVTPTAMTIPAGEFFNATGKASDNVAVAGVWCLLNNGVWFQPNTGNGWSNWNVTLDLVPGTNWFSAYAVDTSGYVSPTNVVKFIYNTAPASLSGLKTEVMPDGGDLFEVAFSATTFGQWSWDTNNVSSVGSYTYTRQSPGSGMLRLTYTAPPSATNDGAQVIQLAFTAPGVARFTNGPNAGGLNFTSTPTLVRPSLVGQTLMFVNQAGQGGQVSFTATQIIRINLDHTKTNGFRNYTYQTYSPLGGLIRETESNLVHYVLLNFWTTNVGSAYSEEYDAGGNLGMVNWSVIGLTSQRPGGNAPTNTDLTAHFALLATDAGANRINFTDSANFTDVDPFNETTVNGFGNYSYGPTGTNTAELDLNYTSPAQFLPLNLLFASPNFAIFTNNADATIGAMGFK